MKTCPKCLRRADALQKGAFVVRGLEMPSQIEDAKTVDCPICEAPKGEACVAEDGTEIKNGAHMGRISEFRRKRAER